MLAMDQEQEPSMANDLRIKSEAKTMLLRLGPRPPVGCGPRAELLLRLAMMECHTWLGIGGRSRRVRRPRRMSRNIWLDLDDNPSSSGGGHDCRRLLAQEIRRSLREEEEEEYRYLAPVYWAWDKTVPLGVEREIAAAVRRGGAGRFVVIVDISIHFEFVYSEPDELMMACLDNSVSDPAGRSGNDGDAPSCSICFEEMSPEAGVVVDLPGCMHGFHLWCIDPWFQKASTCPVCRRDQLQYIRSDYRDLHDKMTIDPDRLPDYL